MKKSVLASLAVLTLLATATQAANTDPVFYADQGKVMLPNMKFSSNGHTYYILLRMLPSTNGNYDFRADMSTLTDITPPLGYTPAAASDLVGTWAPDFDPASSITINANGTYSMVQSASSDQSCPKGGAESGTYQYEPTNGVFTSIATQDANGECGLSHPDGVTRIKKVGTDIYLFFKDGGKNVESKLTRKP